MKWSIRGCSTEGPHLHLLHAIKTQRTRWSRFKGWHYVLLTVSLCVHILQLVRGHSVLHWKFSLLVGLVMIMFIAPVKNHFRGYSPTGACQLEAQREQHGFTFHNVTTTKPNLTTRLLGSEEHFFFSGCRSAGQLEKNLSEETFMAAPLHAFVVFSMLFWWRQCIFWFTGLLSTLYCSNTS